MKLKYNTSAFSNLVAYAAEGGEYGAVGIPAKYFCGLNGGVFIGTNGTLVGFVKSMAGIDWSFISPVRGLWIYKGVPPTIEEFDNFIATAPAAVAATGVMRYSDLLTKYVVSSQSIVKNSLIHTFSPRVAPASGVASWFIFGIYADNSSGANLPSYLVMGTITSDGGGGDIELDDLNIVAGVQYRLPPYELKFPSNLTA